MLIIHQGSFNPGPVSKECTKRRTSIVYSSFISDLTNRLKEAMSHFAHLEKFSLNFSSSSFVIRVNLLHPFTILVSLWFIIISLVFFYLKLVNYYFQVSFNLKVILQVAKVTKNTTWLSSFNSFTYISKLTISCSEVWQWDITPFICHDALHDAAVVWEWSDPQSFHYDIWQVVRKKLWNISYAYISL